MLLFLLTSVVVLGGRWVSFGSGFFYLVRGVSVGVVVWLASALGVECFKPVRLGLDGGSLVVRSGFVSSDRPLAKA